MFQESAYVTSFAPPSPPPMPLRRVPRAFSFPWGTGQILEEAAIEGGLHAPSFQLLNYELGEKKGQYAIRFSAYSPDGRFIVTTTEQGEATIWDTERLKKLLADGDEPVRRWARLILDREGAETE